MIDLQPFCANYDSRYVLSKSFVRKGTRYATDGRICVRVDAAGQDDTEGTTPPSEDLGWGGDGDWKPIPAVEPVMSMQKCPHCTCKTCHGSGETECPTCHNDCDCEECDGDGFDGCEQCHETGMMMLPDFYTIDGIKIAARYWDKIRALPNVMYALPANKSDRLRPIAFRFDGGDGLVMPLRPDYKPENA
jgi:hypothetical protein